MFDIAIIIEPHEERALRELHRESRRSRGAHRSGVMTLPQDFDVHEILEQLIAKIDESKKYP